jgi:membrane protease YdiL (CAAX protease family)
VERRWGPLLPTWTAWVLVLLVGTVVNLLNNAAAPHWYLLTSLAAAVSLLAIGRGTDLSWEDLGLGRTHLATGARWAAAIIAVIALGYLVAAAIPALHSQFHDKRVTEGNLTAMLFQVFVRIPFGTVLLEEVLFRGVILALAARSMGWLRGAVVSSLLFGVWHILPAEAASTSNPAVSDVARAGGTFGVLLAVVLSVLGTGAAGMVFCWVRIRAGSLLASMGLHWGLNGLGYLTAYLVNR